MPNNLPELPSAAVIRSDVLADIHRLLMQNSAAAVVSSEAGPTGKTIAAVQYAQIHANDYPGGQFIVPCVDGLIVGGLIALAPVLGVSSSLKDDQRAVQVQRKLTSGERALLIIDNVPNAEWWAACPLRSEVGISLRVLIVTSGSPFDSMPQAHISSFNESEGLELLGKPNHQIDREKGGQLVQLLQGQPPALLAAAAIVQRTQSQSAEHLLSRLAGAPDATIAIWPALDEILDETERRVLDYSALLPHEQIPRCWLVELLIREKGLTPEMGMRSEPPEAEAIDRLLDLGLLRFLDAGGTLLGMSRSFHAWRIQQIESKPGFEKTLGNALVRFLGDRRTALAKWKQNPFLRSELVPLGAMVKHLAAHNAPQSALALAINVVAMLRGLRRYDEAAAVLKPIVEAGTFQKALSVLQIRALFSLSFIQRERDQDSEAQQYIERAAEMARQEKGEQSQVFGWMLHHQSLVLADQERFAEAESMMWQAMAIRRLHVSAEDKTFWAHHAILATILAKQNKFHLAAQQVRLALDISQQAGRTEEQVASDYSLLAIYLRQAGDLVEAEKASLQCLELSEAVLSFNDPKLAIRFGLHSKILEQQKKWAEARQWLERSIELQLKHVPADDSTMASQYNNLGLICKRQGNYAEALLQLTKAIEINRKYLPPEDPTLATNYHNVSTIHQSLGDLQKALQWNLMAAPIVERLPDRHRIRGILERSRIALQRLLTGR